MFFLRPWDLQVNLFFGAFSTLSLMNFYLLTRRCKTKNVRDRPINFKVPSQLTVWELERKKRESCCFSRAESRWHIQTVDIQKEHAPWSSVQGATLSRANHQSSIVQHYRFGCHQKNGHVHEMAKFISYPSTRLRKAGLWPCTDASENQRHQGHRAPPAALASWKAGSTQARQRMAKPILTRPMPKGKKKQVGTSKNARCQKSSTSR